MKRKKLLIRVSALVIAAIMVGTVIFTAVTVSKHPQTPRIRAASGWVQSSAKAMCTVEGESGRVLYEKNAETQLPMASTTKIITAITVLENCDDIEQTVTIDSRAVGIEGTSIYLQHGESLTVWELLLGLMLRSGNDAAAALALYICPAEKNTPKAQIFDGFNAKMLETAKKAGATASSFKNPHGLDQEGHFTTARDLALISAYALKNPIFAEIVCKQSAKIPGVECPRVLVNKNRLLKSMDTCIGVKTGFTSKAGRCFVGAVREDGMTVVSAILNCGPMFEEASAIMEQACEEYTLKRVLTVDEFIECDNCKEICGIARENFFFPLREGENVSVTCDDGRVCVEFEDHCVYCGEYNRVEI